MTLKLTASSFLQGVRQSGLIEADRLDQIIDELRSYGVDMNNAMSLAQEIVKRGQLTSWQAEQLLQGRSKGFVLGRYRLLSLLGTGENSAVFLARHTGLDRLCAIKILPGHRVKDTSYLGRFFREARAVASLNHVNIVRAYDVDTQKSGDTELHFLVLEYIEGTSLDQLVLMKAGLAADEAVDIIRQAAEGLSHAHQADLVHRDVKPTNLLIDEQGTVKLLDLGLARYFKTSEEESLTLKHDEKVLGTADYLSPEQAVDSHNVDCRTDLYSLGCTLFFTLTGRPPFDEGTLVQRMLAHQTKPVPSILEHRPDVPADLDDILRKLMAKRPRDRYSSAAEVAEVMTDWLLRHAGEEWRAKQRGTLGLIGRLVGSLTDAPATPDSEVAIPAKTDAPPTQSIPEPPVAASQPTPKQPQPASAPKNSKPAPVAARPTTTASEGRPPVRTAPEAPPRPAPRPEPVKSASVTQGAPRRPEPSRPASAGASANRPVAPSSRTQPGPNRSMVTKSPAPRPAPATSNDNWGDRVWTALLGAALTVIVVFTGYCIYSVWRPSTTTTAQSTQNTQADPTATTAN